MKKLLIFLLLILLIPVTQAQYAFDGIPFEIAAEGTVNGGVYIDGGHGLGFPPYSQDFYVPSGSIRWARLYIGAWGGTEMYEGWVRTDLNGNSLGNRLLLGINDDSENVYCAGHGVYWMYYDVTGDITNGENVVTIETSRGEPGNKLDGRVYGAVFAVVYEDTKAPEISYMIYDGNVNLHGRGWSGNQGNENENTSVCFDNIPVSDNTEGACLTVAYLTSSKGLPDYLQFNGYQFGVTPQYLLDMGYQTGVTDIANEVSGDACSGKGEHTSYFDMECFDVPEYVETSNILTFQRGHDLDRDGMIGDDEGEDYLHPVLAVLVVEHGTAINPEPDLTLDVIIDEDVMVGGQTVEIPVLVGNSGRMYDGDFKIELKVDGSFISTTTGYLSSSGVYRSAIEWNAVAGDHILELVVDPDDTLQEADEDNNFYVSEIHVMTGPDLTIEIGEPEKVTNNSNPVGASSLLLMLMVFGGIRKKKKPVFSILLVLMAACLCGCIGSTTEVEQMEYMIPLIVTNGGESKALNFEVNLYLDDELTDALQIEGLDGGTSKEEKMMIRVTKGSHTLRLVVDGKDRVIESDEENNVDKIVYNFT
ncbi:MAG: DUF3344 domain-containing protein [Methanosarcinaceae archaeon]|nr:DUF3344 domain-containing protein [Methanosarcinaceae archaeon]